MRYPTVGDWTDDGQITVADTENDRYNFLIGLHELVEWYLCHEKGITDDEVTKFDKAYEEERAQGLHSPEDEPGHDERAPYRDAHFFAECIERLTAQKLGVEWDQYNKTVLSL